MFLGSFQVIFTYLRSPSKVFLSQSLGLLLGNPLLSTNFLKSNHFLVLLGRSARSPSDPFWTRMLSVEFSQNSLRIGKLEDLMELI